jgi:hypothetical protein
MTRQAEEIKYSRCVLIVVHKSICSTRVLCEDEKKCSVVPDYLTSQRSTKYEVPRAVSTTWPAWSDLVLGVSIVLVQSAAGGGSLDPYREKLHLTTKNVSAILVYKTDPIWHAGTCCISLTPAGRQCSLMLLQGSVIEDKVLVLNKHWHHTRKRKPPRSINQFK